MTAFADAELAPQPVRVKFSGRLQQVLVFAKRIDAAKVFPIARELCDEIKGKVDKYLFKKPEKK